MYNFPMLVVGRDEVLITLDSDNGILLPVFTDPLKAKAYINAYKDLYDREIITYVVKDSADMMMIFTGMNNNNIKVDHVVVNVIIENGEHTQCDSQVSYNDFLENLPPLDSKDSPQNSE